MSLDFYNNPLADRYASKEMNAIFSPLQKYSYWRFLWIILAESQQELGLPITKEQIVAMKKVEKNIDFEKAAAYEEKFQHDVVAHIHTFGDQAPEARGIIHWGATSAFVTDNTDLLQAKAGLDLLKKRLLEIIQKISVFADKYADLPTLGFTHFQPAQLTTVGKRACLWLQSFIFDLEAIDEKIKNLPARSIKGTTGSAESFKQILNNDFTLFQNLEKKITKKMGFEKTLAVSGQTYDRKIDTQIAQILLGIAESAHKFTNDLRLLQHLGEIEEPFGKEQVGSSAMPYKRNPILSERISSLSKFIFSLSSSTTFVAATQWLERSLDDSANKRLNLPQCFLAADAILILISKIINDWKVFPKIIQKNIQTHLPFMAVEKILMLGVKKGGDRQLLHEKLRQHAMEVTFEMKENGKENDFIARLSADPFFAFIKEELKNCLDAKEYIGFAIEQTQSFLQETTQILLNKK